MLLSFYRKSFELSTAHKKQRAEENIYT